jgi:hypothetical protein
MGFGRRQGRKSRGGGNYGGEGVKEVGREDEDLGLSWRAVEEVVEERGKRFQFP